MTLMMIKEHDDDDDDDVFVLLFLQVPRRSIGKSFRFEHQRTGGAILVT